MATRPFWLEQALSTMEICCLACKGVPGQAAGSAYYYRSTMDGRLILGKGGNTFELERPFGSLGHRKPEPGTLVGRQDAEPVRGRGGQDQQGIGSLR
jgi:hypothetical protein